MLLIDTHPLYPTANSVTGALDQLAERLGKSGCAVSVGEFAVARSGANDAALH